MRFKEYFKRFFEGILMGSANIVPGVSGGTIALIVGIYERLVHSINTIPKDLPIDLLKGDIPTFKKKFKGIDFKFLVPLLLGVIVSVMSIARIMEYVMGVYPAQTFAFFFGLILASVTVIYNYIDRIDPGIVISASVGFIFVFFLVGLEAIKANHSLPMIFFSGMIAIISMILPGISGSYILLFLHQYHYMVHALNTMNLLVLSVFMAGAIIGLFTFAKVLDYLFEHHKSITMAFLFGLMLGALRVPTLRG